MAKSPKVSVIIPVYNTEKYLSRCLDSVLSNTYKNLEVICINDGSTDNSINILDNYKASDERVIVINQKNSGVSAARNAGLNAATGEYIAFIDSDDWVHPQYFEILLFAQEVTGAEIVACQYQAVNCEECGQKENILYCTEDVQSIQVNEAIRNGYLKRLVWGRLYKKSIIKERFELRLGWGEDTVFNLCTLATRGLSKTFGVIRVPLYFYFSRPDSITSTVSSSRCIELAKWYLENWKSNKFSTEVQAFLLEQAAKELLAFRYRETFAVNPINSRELVVKCKADIKSSHLLSIKKRGLYLILFTLPYIYRIYRIIDDPSMIQWEKQMKLYAKKNNDTYDKDSFSHP